MFGTSITPGAVRNESEVCEGGQYLLQLLTDRHLRSFYSTNMATNHDRNDVNILEKVKT